MSDAIKPPWAISIWHSEDHIYAELPSINGHATHTVKVRRNAIGLNKILVLLKSRSASSRIGTKGAPTQWQIDKVEYDPAMVRRVGREKPKFTIEQRANVRAMLRKAGLI